MAITSKTLYNALCFNEQVKAIEDRIKCLRLLKSSWNITGGASYSQYRRYSTVEEIVLEIDKEEALLLEFIRKYGRQYREVVKAILKLDNPEALIMTLRYIEGLSWKEIARRTNYSLAHVYRLHNSALKNMRVNES